MQWEQQQNESGPAHEAFLLYRDMGKGERSNAKVGQQLGKSKTQIDRWSSGHNWVARCAAWDEHLQKAADDAALEEIRQMQARHAANALALQNKALEKLMAMDAAEMTVEQLLRMMEGGINIERAARGADGGVGVSVTPGAGGAAEVRICKLYAGIDMEKFQTAHLSKEN